MTDAPAPQAKGRLSGVLNLSNIVAVVALMLAVTEAILSVAQVNAYKQQALFAEQLKACSSLMESANEFRGVALAFETDEALPDKAKLKDARDKLVAATRKVETPLDSLDLLANNKAAHETAELARQADRRLLLLDQADYTPAEAKTWIDGFDAQVGRTIAACHQDLLR